MRKIWLVVAALALPLFASVPLPRTPSHFVTDAAGVLEDTREKALNEALAQFARETGNQVLVYVDRTLPPGSTSIEEMGVEAIRTWRVGEEAKDNGAILFLFIEDHQSRLEVGYALEEKLTDAASKQILFDLRPHLIDGAYATAVEEGAREIVTTIAPDARFAIAAPAPPPLPVYEPVQAPVQMPVQEPVSAPAPLPGTDPMTAGEVACVIPLVMSAVILILVVLVKFARAHPWPASRSRFEEDSSNSHEWPSSSSSSSSFSSSSHDSSSSNDSSSTFSGGGGSGGGGGASDRW